jgi:hypothetical protein
MPQLPTDARAHLAGLVGHTIETPVRREPNRIVQIDGDTVVIATNASDAKGAGGDRIPIAWVQEALDQLSASGEVDLESPQAGERRFRSSFIAALLAALPGVEIVGSPRRARLVRAPSWNLDPGDRIQRTELHRRYGGSARGGTIPSRKSPNVFLFTDPLVGNPHGYFDGWVGEHFYYTGHGQRGDQELRGGNRTVFTHRADGRALRLMKGVGGEVRYLGEFELDNERPFFRMDAPESGGDAWRQVIVFRLVPVGLVIHDSIDELRLPEGVTPAELDKGAVGRNPVVVIEVPVEQQHVEEVAVAGGPSHTALRREQTLVLAYKAHLEKAGLAVVGLRFRPQGEVRDIRADLFDRTRNNLVEAKGSGTRGQIREAIGQILDYERFISPEPRKAVLLPDRPRADLEDLLTACGIHAVWQIDGGFMDNADGAFV